MPKMPKTSAKTVLAKLPAFTPLTAIAALAGLAALAATGCTCKTSRVSDPRSGETGLTWTDEKTTAQDKGQALIKAIRSTPGLSGDVAVLGGKTGLWAVSIDGKAKYKIHEGPVSWSVVDNKLRVIWIVRPADGKWTLELIDFDGPGNPETVLASFPGAPIDIVHEKVRITGGGENFAVTYEIRFEEGKVKLEIGEGNFYFTDRADSLKEKAKSLVFADPERLALLYARAGDRAVQPPVPSSKVPDKISVDTNNCDDPDMCGEVSAIPGTRYWNVLTSHSCGDGCYWTMLLYDPKTKEFFDARNPEKRSAEPDEEFSRLGAGWIAPSGTAHTNGRLIVSFEKGFITQVEDIEENTPDGWLTGGGWLEGGWRLSL